MRISEDSVVQIRIRSGISWLNVKRLIGQQPAIKLRQIEIAV